ncbi:MAG: GNAT family N-acetyltransferase [Acidimicrobiia bacterium]|nr:GNAT family N-acetyltransferase [Acidimicrobiia bacterium]NNC43582.1 GNAT family N-acetyltransferase [Acidimicrobiia bacterium]
MTLDATVDWSVKQWELTASAQAVGPFVRAGFLKAWWSSFGTPDEPLEVVVDDTGLVPLWHTVDAIRFAGDPDLTDYHAPLGIDGSQLLVDFVLSRSRGTSYVFDSMPEEAASSIAAFFSYQGVDVEPQQHAVAMRLALPISFDEYLMSIGKKQRHEMRRKVRRFAEQLGDPILTEGDAFDDLELFFSFHRQAEGDKGTFMTETRADFFRELLKIDGARLDVLRDGSGEPVAASFGFVDADAYYLYNSAYDPAKADTSPGIVMLSMLIEQAIGDERRWFDFLKGDETYKYRLGAEERPLYQVSGIQ